MRVCRWCKEWKKYEGVAFVRFINGQGIQTQYKREVSKKVLIWREMKT